MKNTLIAILVIAIMIVGYLFIREKTKPTDYSNVWPETEPATSTNNNYPTQTSGQDDNQSSSATENDNQTVSTQFSGQHVFETIVGNSSARAVDVGFIVASKVLYETNNPMCGFGNEFIAPCSIYVKDNSGNTRKVLDWPTASAKQKYPNSFVWQNFYLPGDARFDGDIMVFTTRRSLDCNGYDIEYWNLNYKTGEAYLIQTRPGVADDCN